ncbi:hypothetical protein A3I27_03265 [Candidatus Giovannonibacteria bacterium RIFCSPLOWO2_02_FULL_43_11b]|uniref:DUF218 domain-containing protein n=1 Tax=Candidatus Giovannonibacteria bacterium RIFCSPHIGHO2_12_FULL_43_15 TaxID=1798341 RepID=A0A1F5WNX7_9BACT|nr:MAG: hypothetical protein A2739_02690 [Candidatus Giovannonibacteria bacterium RIFCSPHIGHO2_01_FULL_43_100]OGF66030.1 MAG: hypothetical protein A3B97_01465 [Candidatus Giovannonibacteria bacterium RIFCSPHIGHO2_02_FULL_43_32]OGF77297.1 MAG: hypothetical protein A3F23_00385 [Candidatus Giovannonibacteria bacterium RIFCSPHIGHO2_12_FULL_43_15]OGF78018.1 MAG: hypothetical protein A3A15_01170 [Candidatus Giovannonibacteria bacterium RIFCSPLOWO2_01_FULL_43_60]OGF89741.1 MAG: hypothetical protein A3
MAVIIVPSCHFRDRKARISRSLCSTTIERLEKTASIADRHELKNAPIVVTGRVVHGGDRLSSLMLLFLEKNFPELRHRSLIEGSGVGIFSEAELVTAMLPEDEKLVIVSSWWYFLPGRIIWESFASIKGQKIELVPTPRTTLFSLLFYIAYGFVVHASYLLGREKQLADFLTKRQQTRKFNFRFKGC